MHDNSDILHTVYVFDNVLLGSEFNKSLGRLQKCREVFQVYHGECVFLLHGAHKYHLIIAQKGDLVVIPEGVTYFMHNVGGSVLVLGSLVHKDMRKEQTDAERLLIEFRRGGRYHLLKSDCITLKSNPHFFDDFSLIQFDGFEELLKYRFEFVKKGLEILQAKDIDTRHTGLARSDAVYKKRDTPKVKRFLGSLALAQQEIL
jgi:hypothetical protein